MKVSESIAFEVYVVFWNIKKEKIVKALGEKSVVFIELVKATLEPLSLGS